MNIGVVTFHYNNNFGAALQCYGLQKALQDLGHNVEVIDYVPKDGELMPFWRGWNIRGGRFFKVARTRLLQLRYQRVACRAFNSYRKSYFKFSEHCTTLNGFRRVAQRYDAVICGSDQVWVFERPSPYFLDFGEEYSGLRISYAACCGHDRQTQGKREEIAKLLRRFDYISVRNNFSKAIIGPLVDKEIAVVSDPSLLANYDSLMKERKLPCKKYILMYSLSGGKREDQQLIIDAAKEKVGDLPIVSVVANSCPRKSPLSNYNLYDVSPQEWIWLIAHADFVYTDSFHGALFCIKYNRLFIADYKEGWRSLRLLDVSKSYHFESNIAHSADDAAVKIKKIDNDFFTTESLIAEHASTSIKFLERALA